MTAETGRPGLAFEVAVAIMPGSEDRAGPGRWDDERPGALPGYDDAAGLKDLGRAAGDRIVIAGEEAVRAATEAIAGQIGLTAQRIAAAIEAQADPSPQPGSLGLESVAVSFGITLTGGVQALFTAQAESSVQVNITLSPRPATGS